VNEAVERARRTGCFADGVGDAVGDAKAALALLVTR
jgi:hypothetical protein